MVLWKALLIALWAGYCSYDDQGPQMLRRPLLIGPVVGLILGDLKAGLIISATLELTWMGLGNMAGYKTPDMIVGTIVGVTVSIVSGTGGSVEGIAAGVAAANAVAVLAQQLLMVFDFVRPFLAVWADQIALGGDFDAILKINYLAIAFQFLIRAVPTFIVVYFSTAVVDAVLTKIPTHVLSSLSTASGILPAVGLSILMTMMMKGFMWPFLLLGFVLTTYLGLGILPVTLISLSIAMLYTFIMQNADGLKEMPVKTVSAGDDEDGGYDL